MDITTLVLEKLEKLAESSAKTQADIAIIQKDIEYHIRRTDLNEERLNAVEKVVKQWKALVGGAMLSIAASNPNAVSWITTLVTKVFG